MAANHEVRHHAPLMPSFRGMAPQPNTTGARPLGFSGFTNAFSQLIAYFSMGTNAIFGLGAHSFSAMILNYRKLRRFSLTRIASAIFRFQG